MSPSCPPTLVSTLYESESSGKTPQSHLSTGLKHLDSLLSPGLAFPSLTCISSSGPETANPDLLFHLATSHLLSSRQAGVTAILDATANHFDVRKLRDRIVAALKARQGRGGERGSRGDDNDDDDDSSRDVRVRAMAILKRVTLMRAFDFTGVGECVEELREKLDGGKRGEGRRGTVPDSEDEDDGENLETDDKVIEQGKETGEREEEGEQTGFLLIDNFSHMIMPTLKNDLVQGQGLLTSFLRRLRHLSVRHGLCTVLVTDATPTPTSMNKNDPCPSMFASCPLRPSLGLALGHALDLHLLVHLVPKTAQDARAVYGTQVARQKKGETATVVEVLHDRHGSRVGRFMAFSTDEHGQLEEMG